MSVRLRSGSLGLRIAAEAIERLAIVVVSLTAGHITAAGRSITNRSVNSA
jgi:hypothetical protein